MFLTLPTMFVAISNNVAYSLLNSGLPKHKLEVIPPVVFSSEDDSRLKYDCRKLIGISEDDFVALFVGNLRENKGIDVLVDSLGTLAYRFRKLKVVVTTELLQNSFDERRRSLVERIEKHELTDRVVWLGIVENMPELMKVADVVMVPFLNLEGISDYPLVVLEAMITGTPVIASDIGGIREIIQDGETGILVSPGNVKALAQALQSLIVNPNLRNRLASNSYAMFHEIYKKEEIAQQYRHLFVACKGRLSR